MSKYVKNFFTEPLGVYISFVSEKSFESPKSISFTLEMSSLYFNKKFSGLISLKVIKV